MATKSCAACLGNGSVCNNCGWSQENCECSKREHAETGAPLSMTFEPYECEDCSGKGEVAA